VSDYAGDLKGILDELGWQKIHLVGHSMGGRNAFHFAGLYPERVQKLVVEDISPAQMLKALAK
jgi:pimeloyl-ACP methyl ester carboxylesterase